MYVLPHPRIHRKQENHQNRLAEVLEINVLRSINFLQVHTHIKCSANCVKRYVKPKTGYRFELSKTKLATVKCS